MYLYCVQCYSYVLINFNVSITVYKETKTLEVKELAGVYIPSQVVELWYKPSSCHHVHTLLTLGKCAEPPLHLVGRLYSFLSSGLASGTISLPLFRLLSA